MARNGKIKNVNLVIIFVQIVLICMVVYVITWKSVESSNSVEVFTTVKVGDEFRSEFTLVGTEVVNPFPRWNKNLSVVLGILRNRLKILLTYFFLQNVLNILNQIKCK